MGQYTSILLIVVMIAAFYFLIMRPQRKRQQQQVEMMKTLEPGARVVTTTGIYATIIAVGEKQIVLETSPGSRVTMLKQGVGRVVADDEEDAELSSYRPDGVGSPAPAPTEGADHSAGGSSADDGETDFGTGSSASGLAGGAPIQEYTPGRGPDFTSPSSDDTSDDGDTADESAEHETAPWPPAAPNEPSGDLNASGSSPRGSSPAESSLGDSSLGDYERRIKEREEQEDKDDGSGR